MDDVCPCCGETLVECDRASVGDSRDEVEAECLGCGYEVLLGDGAWVPLRERPVDEADRPWDALEWEAPWE